MGHMGSHKVRMRTSCPLYWVGGEPGPSKQGWKPEASQEATAQKAGSRKPPLNGCFFICVSSTGGDSAGAPTGITCDVCEY